MNRASSRKRKAASKKAAVSKAALAQPVAIPMEPIADAIEPVTDVSSVSSQGENIQAGNDVNNKKAQNKPGHPVNLHEVQNQPNVPKSEESQTNSEVSAAEDIQSNNNRSFFDQEFIITLAENSNCEGSYTENGISFDGRISSLLCFCIVAAVVFSLTLGHFILPRHEYFHLTSHGCLVLCLIGGIISVIFFDIPDKVNGKPGKVNGKPDKVTLIEESKQIVSKHFSFILKVFVFLAIFVFSIRTILEDQCCYKASKNPMQIIVIGIDIFFLLNLILFNLLQLIMFKFLESSIAALVRKCKTHITLVLILLANISVWFYTLLFDSEDLLKIAAGDIYAQTILMNDTALSSRCENVTITDKNCLGVIEHNTKWFEPFLHWTLKYFALLYIKSVIVLWISCDDMKDQGMKDQGFKLFYEKCFEFLKTIYSKCKNCKKCPDENGQEIQDGSTCCMKCKQFCEEKCKTCSRKICECLYVVFIIIVPFVILIIIISIFFLCIIFNKCIDINHVPPICPEKGPYQSQNMLWFDPLEITILITHLITFVVIITGFCLVTRLKTKQLSVNDYFFIFSFFCTLMFNAIEIFPVFSDSCHIYLILAGVMYTMVIFVQANFILYTKQLHPTSLENIRFLKEICWTLIVYNAIFSFINIGRKVKHTNYFAYQSYVYGADVFKIIVGLLFPFTIQYHGHAVTLLWSIKGKIKNTANNVQNTATNTVDVI